MPSVYQRTTSVSVTGRFANVHFGSRRAVLAERQIELVVVVVDRRMATDHELARSTRHVGVAPQHAAISLIDGNGPRHDDRTPEGVAHRR